MDWPAPFPALLYCFATIDLLGSLYGGNATGKKDEKNKKAAYHVTALAFNYMTEIMRYPKEQVELLQRVFRHKIVHLAQPKPIIKSDDKYYTWCYDHNKREIHLQIKPATKHNHFVFCISIWSLVEDIVDSVYKPNGYLHKLENNENDLQAKFEKAYNQIFENEPLI